MSPKKSSSSTNTPPGVSASPLGGHPPAGSIIPQNSPHGTPSSPGSMEIDPANVAPPALLPASAIPNEPLFASPAMGAALDDIAAGSTAPRMRRNERKQPAGGNDPYLKLTALVQRSEAQRQVEATKKAEADMAAAAGRAPAPRPDKRSRSASGSSPTGSSKKAKNDQPALDPNAMDTTEVKPTKNRPTSFDHMSNPTRRWCAVMIDGNFNEIMGDPFSNTPGLDLKVSLDPGKKGQPSLGLDFRINKHGIDSDVKDDYNTFALGWEPGVKIGGQWMMEGLRIQSASKPVRADLLGFTYPPAIQKLCTKPNLAARLLCANFRSHVHRSSQMTEGWAEALKGQNKVAVSNNLKRMYSAKKPSYMVTVWFLATPGQTLDKLWEVCFGPLVAAVEDHTPPFHQYLDEKDEPLMGLDLPTIDQIGNGMYKRSPKIIDRKGKKVEQGKVTYYNLPKTVKWDSIKTFHITFGVPVGRDMQYNEGIHIRLQRDWHRLFVQRLPVFSIDGKNFQKIPAMSATYQVGVRLTRNPVTGVKDAIPEAGSSVQIEFCNENKAKGKVHKTIEEDICVGRVDNIGGREFLDKTKTDFCVLMTIPRRCKQKILSYTDWSDVKKKDELQLAKLKVRVNHAASIRDIVAFKKFCNEKYEPELLDDICLAFWSDPSKVYKITDLTEGPAHSRSETNKEKYMEILKELKKDRKSNASQDEVLRAATHMRNRISIVQGPPGAGKTRTLRDKIIALTKIGHKTVCVAGSNAAVDTDARAVWNGLSAEDKKVIKCLRLETDNAEKSQRLKKLDYAQYTGEKGEADQLPEYLPPREANEHPATQNSLDRLCMEFTAREEYATKILEQYNNYNQAYKAVMNYDVMKRSNCPIGMTLDYRIWEITQTDMQDAEAAYAEARNKLSAEEYTRQVTSGQINVAMYDKSRKYKESIAIYISKTGQVSVKERTELEDQHKAIVERVLAETHILFSMASNCGGDVLECSHSFVPTIIFCDEAGQISVPSLCVPLTTFNKWEGLILMGDVQQLHPPSMSGQFNEFSANAKVSPLALLATKGFESYLLDTQFRMTPAISAFPRVQFYDNKGLKDDLSVKEDNEVRQVIREIAMVLGVTGDKGKGSEYIVTDVVNGCSRLELNGTSLVNHANADVEIRMINRLLSHGKTDPTGHGTIKPEWITILTYYQGQRRHLRDRINHIVDWSQETKNSIEISTVDAFQGRENRIVILDIVAAKDQCKGFITSEEDTAEDEDDLGNEDYIKVGKVTGHVRDPTRLNVGLTRGKDATLVICQAALLVATTRKNRGKQYNALANMVGNAASRRCLLEDKKTEDSHPEAVRVRKELGEARLEEQREAQYRNRYDFITTGKLNWASMKKLRAIPLESHFAQYHTGGGHTTRPIGNRKLATEADAHDAEIKRAEAASLASKAAEAEDKRLLDLGIQQSLEDSNFPGLPKSQGANAATTTAPNIEMDITQDDGVEELVDEAGRRNFYEDSEEEDERGRDDGQHIPEANPEDDPVMEDA